MRDARSTQPSTPTSTRTGAPAATRTAKRTLRGAWHRGLALLRTVVHRSRFEADMDEEIRFHLDERANELTAQGMPPKEARRQARLEFGGPESHRDGMRSAFGLRWLDELTADLHYSTRLLRKSPGFTAIAVASLALAIGANTTIFSAANQLLFERLAIPNARQLHNINHMHAAKTKIPFHMNWGSWFTDDSGNSISDVVTYPIYQQLKSQAPADAEIFAFKGLGTVNASVDGSAFPITVELVSGNYYAGMQTVPQLGRGIQPSDDGAPGTGAVAVLSEGTWKRVFGGSPAVLGKVIHIDTLPVTIVGVNAHGFTGAEGVQRSPGIFMPLSFLGALRPGSGEQDMFHSTQLSWVMLLTRIASPGTGPAQARLDTVFHNAVRSTMTLLPGEIIPHLVLQDGSQGQVMNILSLRKPVYILLGLVAAVLLLACANIANLMLARASQRQREMSLRLALGASRVRIFRQSLTEALLIACLGGVTGAVLGYLSRNTLPHMMANSWQRNDLNVPFNLPVFAFVTGVTLLTGILFGLAPAWRAARSEGGDSLKLSTHAVTLRRKGWSSRGIVAFQIAIATLLVVASGLFLRTVWNLTHIQPGFNAKNLLNFQLLPSHHTYAGETSLALYRALEERIGALPGVQGVTGASIPLVAGWMSNSDFRVEGQPPAEPHSDNAVYVNMDTVGPDFFRVLQIPILAGRGFTHQDTPTSPHVSVINESLARKYFPGRNPVGLRFTTSNTPEPGSKNTVQWLQVVGVCADTQFSDLKSPREPLHFESFSQSTFGTNDGFSAVFSIRSTLPAAQLAAQIQKTINAIDPDLPMIDIRTQEDQIAGTIQQERTFASLAAGFGILALLLACVGVYGIMAYTVSQRTNEIGIRLALGAQRGQVRAMVLREAALLTVAGVVAGLGVALGCVHLVKSMLYGLKPHDPASLTAAPLLLLAVALLASWLPAARASRVEPMVALRHE